MLILASSSKARQKLLDQVLIEYKAIDSNLNEEIVSIPNIKKLVQYLAEKKASLVASAISLNKEEFPYPKIVLGCDSLFEFEGEIFGKPANQNEAIERWKKMSGLSGFLHTGHCLFSNYTVDLTNGCSNADFSFKEVISTEIEFVTLTDSEILDYVKTGEPLNCAGGFAIEGKGGFFIRKINGCFSNVIGLSLPWLMDSLKNLGYFSKKL